MKEHELPEEVRKMFQQAREGPKLQDGWYRVLTATVHHGKNGMATMPLQVINGVPRVVTEFMVGFDKTDRQVKSSIQIDPSRLQKIPPTMGADYLHQSPLLIPEETEPNTLDSADEQA